MAARRATKKGREFKFVDALNDKRASPDALVKKRLPNGKGLRDTGDRWLGDDLPDDFAKVFF